MTDSPELWSLLFLLDLPFVALVVWLYFRWRPRDADARACTIYDVAAIVLSLAARPAFAIVAPTSGFSDPQWFGFTLALGSLYVFPVLLIAAGLLRNLVVFRPQVKRGTGEATT